MKTKFDDIVKIRKRKVDQLQDHLAKIEFSIKSATAELDALVQDFYSEELPSNGTISELLQLQEIKRAYKVEIENKKANLSNLIHSKSIVFNMLKEANMEYEKIKYLHETEIKKYLIARQQKESKDLDEIAVMLFNSKA